MVASNRVHADRGSKQQGSIGDDPARVATAPAHALPREIGRHEAFVMGRRRFDARIQWVGLDPPTASFFPSQRPRAAGADRTEEFMVETNDLGNRCALVTGAARGIGRAIALSLAMAGSHV